MDIDSKPIVKLNIDPKPIVKRAWPEKKVEEEKNEFEVEDLSVDLGGLGPSNVENSDDVENSDNVDV